MKMRYDSSGRDVISAALALPQPARWGRAGIASRLIPLAFLLTACTHAEPVVVTKTVNVPVSVPCVTAPPAEPSYATDSVDLASPLFDLVRALLIEREQRKIETGELRATIAGCQ